MTKRGVWSGRRIVAEEARGYYRSVKSCRDRPSSIRVPFRHSNFCFGAVSQAVIRGKIIVSNRLQSQQKSAGAEGKA